MFSFFVVLFLQGGVFFLAGAHVASFLVAASLDSYLQQILALHLHKLCYRQLLEKISEFVGTEVEVVIEVTAR